MGLRYEYNTPPVDPTNHMSSFDPVTGTVVPVGTSGVSDSGIQSGLQQHRAAGRDRVEPRPNGGPRGLRPLLRPGMFEVNSALYFNPPQFTLRVYFPTQSSLLTLSNPFPTAAGSRRRRQSAR